MPSTLAHLSTLAAAALLLGAPAANAQLVNGGFDAPETQQTGDGYCYLGIGDYRECGSVPGWSGYFQVISAQSSAWQTPAANGGWSSSQGSRLAGLQNSSHMTQDVTLAAGSYTLSWLDSNRVWYAGNTYEVRLDGNLLGSFSTVPGAAPVIGHTAARHSLMLSPWQTKLAPGKGSKARTRRSITAAS